MSLHTYGLFHVSVLCRSYIGPYFQMRCYFQMGCYFQKGCYIQMDCYSQMGCFFQMGCYFQMDCYYLTSGASTGRAGVR